MVVIGQNVITDIVTIRETTVIEDNEIDMNVIEDDLPVDTAADAVDVYDIDPEFVPTPNGHKYWVPNVPVDEKPKIDTVFNTFDDAYDMYKEYAVKARFSIRKSGLKRKKGEITHRYVLCNKAGKPRKTVETNTLIEDGNDDGKENENEDGKKRHKAHRLRVALLGGFDKVRGMPIDWNNFKRGMNKFIGERDAQMLVDKMVKRQLHVPDATNAALCDIVSFDATYDTNKYDMVFVPFTGIDHHQKCVSFGAALLSDETTESYAWMLTSFLKVHKKQPILAVTDQDGALRNAILQVFTQSHHRLCMWHITQKLPAKVLGDVDVDSDFRKDFHKLFELRNKETGGFLYIFSEVIIIAVVLNQSNGRNRGTHNVFNNENTEKAPVMLTKLPIERHACAIGYRSVGDVEECIIRQRDKRRTTVVEAKVSHNQEDGSFECSLCLHYNRMGFCVKTQHVFCVFGTLGMDTIPENYISRRWRKNPLPDHLRDKRHRYGPCIEESESLASDIYSRVEDCINLIRNDPEKLKVLLAKVTDMKKELQNDMSSQNEPQNKDVLYEELLGVKAPETVVIMNPNKCGNKGHRRFKSAAEKGKAIKKARMNRKVPFKHRECSKCGQMFHNKRTCDEKRLPDEEYQALLKKKKDDGEVEINESEDDEEDVEVDDVDEDDGTDEHDEDEDED
ncbi:FAR1-related sequence 5-like protein [Tanacetum coccineum]